MGIIKENIAGMTAEISLNENMIYVVKDGQVHQIEPPTSGFGEQVAVWIAGKVDRIDTKFTEKLR